MNNNAKIRQRWRSMMKRVNNKKCQLSQPTYYGCILIEDWYDFQNFSQWCSANFKSYMSDWELDNFLIVQIEYYTTKYHLQTE